jgi:hypothetical protein
MKKVLVAIAFILMQINAIALPDEGMWLPMLIKRLNAEDMAKHGCKLTAEEIYNINHSSLKDAIVSLEFCTAEIVSQNGLLLTNHHCAYDAIQTNSSVEHNYLDDGFWAKSYLEELQIPGQTASVLVRMDDVTARVLGNITDSLSSEARSKSIAEKIKEISKEASDSGKYRAIVKDMFNGNEYYLFVYETYTDVRLVGAPPQSVGKFGGDTDNWMWPRHTGDFSLMRIYMNKDGKPAEYSQDNVPYQPKHVIPISLKGYKEGDFAMIMGFPGRTNRYITSPAMELQLENINPVQIKLFGKKLDVYKKDMDDDVKTRIQYSSKHASLSNSWKYYIGQTEGLIKSDVIETRKKEEAQFVLWANANESTKKYATILSQYKTQVESYKGSIEELYYIILAGKSSEAIDLIYLAKNISKIAEEKPTNNTTLEEAKKEAKEESVAFYKDYSAVTDQHLVIEMMTLYLNDISLQKLPPVVAEILKNKGKTNHEKVTNWANHLFEKSIFVSPEKFNQWVAKPNPKQLAKDPLVQWVDALNSYSRSTISPKQMAFNSSISSLKRTYLEGLLKYKSNQKLYPDANSTERLTYGNVKAYDPRDAVNFNYYTTTDGILEKMSTDKKSEFYCPEKLADLIRKKDFGRYAENGQLRVAFLTNNDITGGNSGSPVMDANGSLIGIAFDGNWESMTGDLVFDNNVQRTICVDIRYVLFIMDKYAGATNLVNEFKISN